MSSQMGTTLANRRMQNLETLHYYLLDTLFPLPGYLDDQRGKFLESWMAYLDFEEFPNCWSAQFSSPTTDILCVSFEEGDK